MTMLLPFLWITALLIGCFGFWAMTLQRRWAQWMAAAIFLPLLCAALFVGSTLLGRPKPMAMELISGDAELIASSVIPSTAIYVWLLLPGSMEPRSYQLPYSTETEQRLHKARQAAGKEGKVGVRVDGGGSQGEPMFYARPQQEMPPKEGQP